MNRLMIFIDAEYVIQSMRCLRNVNRIGKTEINWQNIINWITGNRQLIRCYYYSAELSKEENLLTYQDQQEYITNLKLRIPYLEIKLGRMIKVGNIWQQKGLDVKISLDMITKAFKNQYDIAAIIAGDSDFVNLIAATKEDYGKQVELYTFDRTDAQIREELKLSPDKHVMIDSTIGQKVQLWN